MGKYRIPPDAWRAATLVLLRYPETLAEIEACVSEAMTRDPEATGSGSKPAHPDPTASAAIRLTSSVKYDRLKREARAVEQSVEDLDDIQLAVIRARFWGHRKGHRRPKPYACIDVGYERRQMQRIVREVIHKVAVNLGEM